ncbi:hypothetical protein [Nocardia noduli]|uniref:hypothetical protein n=1 Tax=Nocardia noduli TaxID=2815722 RepID=UPI001C21F31D|nr:hypothetical protein [Nocardia noduli]
MTADTPRSRCEYYRQMCHLPATVDPNTGRISVRAGLLWAIQLPAELAQMVKMDLDRRQHGGGPVISHPREAQWTFLIRSDIPAQVAARDTVLWRSRVKILRGLEALVSTGTVERDRSTVPAQCLRAGVQATHPPDGGEDIRGSASGTGH